MDHVRKTCEKPCDEMKGCMICNLFYCGVCTGFEGTLATECPGRPISSEVEDLIYKSCLDFRDGRWMRRPWESWETPDVEQELRVDGAVVLLNKEWGIEG